MTSLVKIKSIQVELSEPKVAGGNEHESEERENLIKMDFNCLFNNHFH